MVASESLDVVNQARAMAPFYDSIATYDSGALYDDPGSGPQQYVPYRAEKIIN